MPDVLLATCADLPGGDEDADLLGAALARTGVDFRWAVWDDPAEAWDALVVLRSTWDYTSRRPEFVSWVESLNRVENGADVVAWSSDKTYLRELESAGVPVTPTSFLDPSAPVGFDVPGEIVVKPSVGAGSIGAARFGPDETDRAYAHARTLQHDGRTVLVQPYLAQVDDTGEAALVYVDGGFSHAATKGAMLAPAHESARSGTPPRGAELYVQERMGSRTASADELAVGDAALAFVRKRFGADQLYARVDLLPGPDGPVVVELELVEPSLFLGYAPGAEPAPADRFAQAIAARL